MTPQLSSCAQGLRYPPMGDMPTEPGSARVRIKVPSCFPSKGIKDPMTSSCRTTASIRAMSSVSSEPSVSMMMRLQREQASSTFSRPDAISRCGTSNGCFFSKREHVVGTCGQWEKHSVRILSRYDPARPIPPSTIKVLQPASHILSAIDSVSLAE